MFILEALRDASVDVVLLISDRASTREGRSLIAREPERYAPPVAVLGFFVLCCLRRSLPTQVTKSLSENFSVKLEEGRISPRMRLPIAPSSKEMRLMREATTTRGVNYFNLPRPL